MISAILGVSLITRAAIAEQVRVYFGTEKSDGIYFSSFNNTNSDLSVPQLAVKIDNPGFIVIHPNKKYIYATTSGMPGEQNGGVAALKINGDGTLTIINKQSSEGHNPCHVSIDKTGQCLMVTNYSSGSIAVLKINDDGSLSKSVSVHQHEGSFADSKRQKSPHPHSIYSAPNNKFVYVPDLGVDKVIIYKLNPAKALLTEYGYADIPGNKMGPRHMKWSKDGKYAYVLHEFACKVTVFKASRWSGKLKYMTELSTIPDDVDKTKMYCSEIRIHPNRKFIYAATRDNNFQDNDLITVFNSFESKISWQRIEAVSAKVSLPRNFNIDSTGKWILVGGQDSHDIAIFSIDDKTGKLTFTGKIPFDGNPICIEFL